jgi:hypothetical protein
MKSKILIGLLVAIALALAVGLGAAPSAAQGPTTGPTNVSPFTAIYADFQAHQIPAGAYLWYKFDYAGDNSKINIVIPNGGANGLEFRVYTTQQASNIENEDKFIGRSNRDQVPCMDGGKCASVDLTWSGAFRMGGPYFVLVINPNPVWKSFTLQITGTNTGETVGVWFGIPTPTPAFPPTPMLIPTITTTTTTAAAAPAAPTVAPLPVQPVAPVAPAVPTALAIPSPTPVKGVQNDSPYTAVYVRDNRDQNIPANSSMWYKFDYGGDKSRIMILLYNGSVSGLWFALFTPEQAINFTDDKFIGRGMSSPVLCDTGKCSGNDLVWVGNFGVPGTYFIRVTNPNDKPWTFKLHIEGDNINIVE